MIIPVTQKGAASARANFTSSMHANTVCRTKFGTGELESFYRVACPPKYIGSPCWGFYVVDGNVHSIECLQLRTWGGQIIQIMFLRQLCTYVIYSLCLSHAARLRRYGLEVKWMSSNFQPSLRVTADGIVTFWTSWVSDNSRWGLNTGIGESNSATDLKYAFTSFDELLRCKPSM